MREDSSKRRERGQLQPATLGVLFTTWWHHVTPVERVSPLARVWAAPPVSQTDQALQAKRFEVAAVGTAGLGPCRSPLNPRPVKPWRCLTSAVWLDAR